MTTKFMTVDIKFFVSTPQLHLIDLQTIKIIHSCRVLESTNNFCEAERKTHSAVLSLRAWMIVKW